MKIRKMATIPDTLPTVLKDSVPIASATIASATIASDPPPYLAAFFLTVIAFTLAYLIISSATAADIINKWSEVRCETQNIILAGLYGHDVGENFQFCLQQIIGDSTKSVAGPFAEGIGGFSSILSKLMDSINSIRATIATLSGGIFKIVEEFKARMTALMGRVKLTGSRMKAMMFRLYGTMFAVMYMGISAQTGIANFGDTFIFKFIDAFCFLPNTKVILDDKTTVNIQELKLGQKLYNGSVVEAVIECPVPKGPLYEIYGVKVSGGHKVWSQEKSEFICVKEHPDANLSGKTTRTLWTLITSDREIPVLGNKGYVRFADWEEMPPTLKSSVDWHRIAYIILNGKEPLKEQEPVKIHEGPALEEGILVYKYQAGLTSVSDLRIGDWIYDRRGWTRVIGKCERLVSSSIGRMGERITDGNWILQRNGTWQHPIGKTNPDKWHGYQLITESGSFTAMINLHEVVVRDFTEVGCESLIYSYEQEDAVR